MPFLALVPIGIWISIGLSVAMTAIQYGLSALTQKKPKAQTFTFDDDTQTAYDPLAPWKILYGEGRTGGTIVYKRTNDARTNLWMVVAIGPGPITSFGDLWMGDEPIFLTGSSDGGVQGRYATKLFCWTHLGDEDQTVDTNLQAAFPDDWTDNHRLRGIAYFVLKFVNDSTLFGRGIPNPSISYRGLAHTDPRTGLSGYTDNPAVVIRSWLMNTTYGRRQPASRMDDASISEEADYCDEYVKVPPRSDYVSVWQAQTISANDGTDVITVTDGFSGIDRDYGLRYNDAIRFVNSGGGLPGGLSAGVTFYARPLTNLTFKVAASKTATSTIDITSAGTGTNTVILQGYRMTLGGDFAPASLFTNGTDLMTMRENVNNLYPRWMRKGSRFQLVLGSGGVIPSGLAVATDYFAITLGTSFPQQAQLAATTADAESTTPINFTTNGGQPIEIVIKSHGGQTQVVTSPIVQTASEDRGFLTGDVVIVDEVSPGSPLPAGFNIGDTFFWRNFGTAGQQGTLHRTRFDAENGLDAVPVPDANTFRLDSDHALQSDIQFMPTGTIITLGQTCTGTIGGGVSLNVEYYVINRGRGFSDGHVFSVIDLAATLDDALNDVPLTVTSGITTQTIHEITRQKERRFTINGSFDTDTSYGEVLQALLSSCGGYADPSGGKWRILPARYRPPSVTLGVDDVFEGAVELSTLLPANKKANTLTGTYTNPKNLDIPANFPTLIDGTALDEDGGNTIQDDITLPFTNSEPMAIRLARIELNRRRRQKTITVPTDLAGGWPIAVGDSFIVNLPGLTGDGTPQVYECTRWALSMTTPTDGGAPLPLVTLTGRENDPFIYRLTYFS